MSEKAPYPTGPYPEQPYPPQAAYPNMPPPSYDHTPQQPGFMPPPPQHQAFIPPQQPQVTTVIYGTPQVGPEPSSIMCPSCRTHIVTRLDYETSTKTHIMAGLLCAFVCWPCAWIPYVMDSCKNANHYCPSCGAFIGTYKG